MNIILINGRKLGAIPIRTAISLALVCMEKYEKLIMQNLNSDDAIDLTGKEEESLMEVINCKIEEKKHEYSRQ